MPITKHHKKKYPHSEWVRRRNIRRTMTSRVSKQNISDTVEAIPSSEKPLEKISLPSPSPKPKGFIKKNMDAIRSAFAGLRRRSKNVA